MRLLAILALTATTATADPSTTSIENSARFGGLETSFIVAPSDEKQPSDGDLGYWVIMPNTAASELRIELGEITLAARRSGAEPIRCNVKDCFGVFRTLRIDPSETLYVASNREILSLTLIAPGENGSTTLPTMVGLFGSCTKSERLVAAIFEKPGYWGSYPNVVYAPFPAALDIGLDPVCIH